MFEYNSSKALILELLAAVCLVELGHDVVLAAFDNFRIVNNLLFPIGFSKIKFRLNCNGISKHQEAWLAPNNKLIAE